MKVIAPGEILPVHFIDKNREECYIKRYRNNLPSFRKEKMI